MGDEFDPNQPFEAVDEFDPNQPFEAVDEVGYGTRALQALGKINKVRNAAVTSIPAVKHADALRVALMNKLGYKTGPVSRDNDLKEALTTWEGGPSTDEIYARGGMDPKYTGAAGLVTDLVLPDPTAKLLGVTKLIGKGGDLAWKHGLKKLLDGAEDAGKSREAAFQVAKKAGVAGTSGQIRSKVLKGIDKADNAADDLIADASSKGATVDANAFAVEAQALLDKVRKFDGDAAANALARDFTDVFSRAGQAGRVALQDAQTFIQRWGAKGSFDKNIQELRKLLRGRFMGDAPKKVADKVDDLWNTESHLLTMKGAARRQARAGSSWSLTPTVAAGVAGGASAWNSADPTDALKGAMIAAGMARGLTSPLALTRGGQFIGKTSPWLGKAATQGAHRLLPEEEQDVQSYPIP